MVRAGLCQWLSDQLFLGYLWGAVRIPTTLSSIHHYPPTFDSWINWFLSHWRITPKKNSKCLAIFIAPPIPGVRPLHIWYSAQIQLPNHLESSKQDAWSHRAGGWRSNLWSSFAGETASCHRALTWSCHWGSNTACLPLFARSIVFLTDNLSWFWWVQDKVRCRCACICNN